MRYDKGAIPLLYTELLLKNPGRTCLSIKCDVEFQREAEAHFSGYACRLLMVSIASGNIKDNVYHFKGIPHCLLR